MRTSGSRNIRVNKVVEVVNGNSTDIIVLWKITLSTMHHFYLSPLAIPDTHGRSSDKMFIVTILTNYYRDLHGVIESGDTWSAW